MKIKYIYLDDEKKSAIQAYTELDIIHKQPSDFSSQVKKIEDLLNNNNCDGLILDLRLDLKKNSDEHIVDYRASSIAQEIRTRAKEGRVKDCPIVLLSTSTKLAKSYTKGGFPNYDLYDQIYIKDDIPGDAVIISSELVSLVKGYEKISTLTKTAGKHSFYQILDLTENDSSILHPNIRAYFEEKRRYPTHEYVSFLIKEIIDRPGLLISEKLLAARLGIDIQKSGDWPNLKKSFHSIQYTGPFCEAWSRWWSYRLTEWWNKLKYSSQNLGKLDANARIDFLIKTTKFKNLKAAEPIDNDYSNRFWTICAGLEMPLDPIDGLLIKEEDNKPWQEKSYISKKAALERIGHNKGLRVHPSEKERYNEIKLSLKNA
jgi:hypothetical protein